jgi:16S rRNA (guanine966-N2)-methyltransferase
MRIITGKYKGRLLSSLRDNSVRPATDRVKGTIFNMLQNRLSLTDIHVLDLFAGSGSLGFEALSRGAANVVFVDENRNVLDMLLSNAEKLDCSESCYILQADALSFIGQSNDKFDLIFADPPYVYTETPRLPDLIFRQKLLKSEGFLIIEHEKQTSFEPSEFYRLAVQKEFGNTRVSFFIHPS